MDVKLVDTGQDLKAKKGVNMGLTIHFYGPLSGPSFFTLSSTQVISLKALIKKWMLRLKSW